MDTLYIVMPAYNEEENIERAVRQWYPLLEGKSDASRLVIADSGSTDNTHRILLSLQNELPQFEILEDTLKQHGPKLIALYNYAISQNADYVFQTDSDGQTDPGEFGQFWDLRNDYDAILGNRTVRGDGRSRAVVEKVVCLLLRLFFGVKVPDANAPFRLMKCEALKKYMDRFNADYNIPNIMITAFLAYYHEKISFMGISFKPRQAGNNSINIPKIIRIGIDALKDFYEFRRNM